MEKIFKAKRLDTGEWLEFDMVSVIMGDESLYVLDLDTICQYTGINDHQGNRIFEGDYLKERGDLALYNTYQVDFDKEDCRFTIDGSSFSEWNLSELVLIGNIHDRG